MDTQEIVNRCQLGDLDSFEELYKCYYPKAFGTALILSGQKSLAEDIVQEAFLICYKAIGQLKDSGSFNTWFYRIVVRCGWKLSKTVKNPSGSYAVEPSAENTVSSPDMAIDTVCDRLLIQQKLKSMKLSLRTVLILYYFNQMSIKEIAKVTDCFEGTVKSRLFKARKILQAELAPYYTEDALKLKLKRMEA